MIHRTFWRASQSTAAPPHIFPLPPPLGYLVPVSVSDIGMSSRPTGSFDRSKPYPESWDKVADLRVFRTSPREWEKLIAWRADMRKRGWKLLKVTSDDIELVAVFGKTKSDLNPAGA